MTSYPTLRKIKLLQHVREEDDKSMDKSIKISQSEYEVMEVIWEANDWMDINAVLARLPSDKKWVYNTVGTFMIRLVEKGVLKSQKQGRNNYYIPIISKAEYKKHETKNFLKNIHGGSRKSLIATLYQDELSEDEINELLAWIEKR